MRILLFLIVTTSLLAQTPIQVPGKYVRSTELRKTMKFSTQDHRTLSVDLVNGTINVTGYSGDSVTLYMHQIIHGRSERVLDSAVRATSMKIQENTGTITIDQVVPYRDKNGGVEDQAWAKYGYDVESNFEILVPYSCNLKLATMESGEITIRSVTGTFDISHINGNISLNDMKGSGTFKTINGKITSEFSATPTGACSFATTNGGITAMFPPGLTATLSMKTGLGELFSDFTGKVATDSKKGSKPFFQRIGKKKIYRNIKPVTISIGKGGPELSFSTESGNIAIRKHQ